MSDWFADTVGLVLFDYKTLKPAIRSTYQKALTWAIQLAHTPKFRHYYSGLAAYDAWAAAIGCDHEFFGQDQEALQLRLMCHNDAVSCIEGGRFHAAAFVRHMKQVWPELTTNLEAAASCYDEECEVVRQMIGVLGDCRCSPESAQQLTDSQTRQKLVSFIKQARDLDTEAVGHMEAALADDDQKPDAMTKTS